MLTFQFYWGSEKEKTLIMLTHNMYVEPVLFIC